MLGQCITLQKAFRGRARRRRAALALGLVLALLSLLVPALTPQGLVAHAATATITAVTFGGDASSPTITVLGSGFGSEPSADGTPGSLGYTGYNFGSAPYQLAFMDTMSSGPRGAWTAGTAGNHVGLSYNGGLPSYSDTQIQYGFGNAYGTGGYPSEGWLLNQGDSFTVYVLGQQCSGTVAYGQTVPCAVYVAPSGTDSPTCGPANVPCQTITYAIGQAAAGDTIDIAAGTYSGDITINKNVTLQALTPGSVTLSGGNSSASPGTVVTVNNGVVAIIDGLTITGGYTTGFGGGIYNGGTLSVVQSAITGNSAPSSGDGGGIYNGGALSVSGSTVSGNSAGFGGGISSLYGTLTVSGTTISGNTAVFNGGGIDNDYGSQGVVQNSTISGNTTTSFGYGGAGVQNFEATLTVVNSTISGNTSASNGGGIENYNDSGSGYSGSLTVSSSTIVNNTAAGSGGGINDDDVTANGAFALSASLILDNGGSDLAGRSPTTSSSNLIGIPNGQTLAQIVATDGAGNPLLADNGGATKTIALVPGSPAIDQVPQASCQATDQRGVLRPGHGGTTCDIGAYESQTLYVAPGGQNTIGGANNNCLSSTAPCQTIGYALSQAGSGATIVAMTGTYPENPLIDTNVTLLGLGAGQTIIDGNHNGPVLTVASGVTATVAGVTLQNGSGGSSGGGVENAGALDLENSIVVSNTGASGGIDNSGTRLLLVNDSIVTNTATGAGGGLYNLGPATVIASTFFGNSAGGNGGGIYSAAPLAIANSAVSSNTAAAGGGIASAGGPLTSLGNIIAGNTASGGVGGGLYAASGAATVMTTTVAGNTASSATGAGGGIATDPGAGMTIAASTINANSATAGGGIANSGTMTLTNTTVSSNTVAAASQPMSSEPIGGGILNNNTGAALAITNSTIVSNTAAGGAGAGGGLYGPATLLNTILAGNTAASGPDCDGTLTSNGHNLVGDNAACNGSGTDDLMGVDPRLDGLAYNGGAVRTQEPLPGSPAIDAGSAAGCPATDARGLARPAGSACDIGAVEVGNELRGDALTIANGSTVTGASHYYGNWNWYRIQVRMPTPRYLSS